MKGAKVKPYSDMLDYISGAAPKMTAITGQALGESFFDMMRQDPTPMITSAPPSHAILQMQKLVADKEVLMFAHAIQNVHFRDGKDLNISSTYEEICDALSLPQIDTQAITQATEHEPMVAESYKRAGLLNISSFPTCLVLDESGQPLGRIDSVYDPQAFLSQVDAVVSAQLG